MEGKRIGIISLGCDKNRVDTENMLAFLQADGYEFTGNPADADIIIVNTCAFIESAKTEAIETIFEMSEYKKSGNCKCLVVTGCLPQRYMSEIKAEMSEVDIFLGTASYRDLPAILKKFTGEQLAVANDKDQRDFTRERVLTTPYHYAYLKIAEGCSNNCTYCAIPSIRGKYTSREKGEIIAEAQDLIVKYGVKELNIVAQDITRYGIDIYGQYELIPLVNELSKLNVEWIRLLYCYPELVTTQLLEFVRDNKKVVKYLDIPMQHVSDKILKRMNRRVRKSDLTELIANIRRICPDLTLRTTFIVGFPDETEEDYNELYEFVKENRFDRCGFFAYSCEENTPASCFDNQVEDNIKKSRVERLYELQNGIMLEKAKNCVGGEYTVVYEDIDYDNQLFVGRMASDAPEIDRLVYFTADRPIDIGEFYNVKIIDTDGIDLIGELK